MSKGPEKTSKKTILDFAQMMKKGEKVVYLTAYDYLTAKMQERAGVDMILVGDSLGMVSLGYTTTFPVTMDDMTRHCQAVRRGAPNTFVIGDMPYMSYQTSNEQAIANAGRLVQEAGVDAIKLEGGGPLILERISAIQQAGILVMGHIGLTPQFMGQLGGFRAQGRDAASAMKIVEQAKAVEKAGAFSILLEGIPAVVGKAITERAEVLILGIGAGSYTHGQVLIYADMVGLYDDFTPKFVKKFANFAEIFTNTFKQYADEVRANTFPNDAEHSYKMSDEETKAFLDLLDKANT